MKIEKQSGLIALLDPRSRTQPSLPEAARSARKASPAEPQGTADVRMGKDAGFSLQLNQQLSALQSADAYLGELATALASVKLGLGRQLGSPQSSERDAIEKAAAQFNDLLGKRSARSGGSLDGAFNLRLNEPLRSRFSLQGLESVEAIQASGRETLLFRAGRQITEPVAVVLDDNLSARQILRRFNASLGQTGLRAELDADGALKFTAPEAEWLKTRDQLVVQGEGKLFERSFQALPSHDDGVQALPTDVRQYSARELRQYLDQVLGTLERVTGLREQLGARQADVQAFLARHATRDDRDWAMQFASRAFEREGRSAAGFAAVNRAVAAQAHIGRFAVVSLLA